MRFILASASPRRKEILEGIGLAFEIITADIDETCWDFSNPENSVSMLALEKGRAVRPKAGDDCVIIAADTVVCVDGNVMGKPRDFKDAEEMLFALSGRAHEVITGVAVLGGEKEKTFYEKTEVFFKNISAGQIKEYIKTGEPMDKAGAYAIQGLGGLFISGIKGDFQNVVGLPLSALHETLVGDFGIDIMRKLGKGGEINVKLF